MNGLTEKVRTRAREILEQNLADFVLGYTRTPAGQSVPAFVTHPDEVDTLVFDEFCFVNLSNYLMKPEVRALGKPAIVSKACDNRSLSLLLQEKQIDREAVYILAVDCPGMEKAVCAYCTERAAEVYDDYVAADEPVEEAPAASPLSGPPGSEERWQYWMKEFERCIRCYACREVCPMCYCPQCVVERNQPQGIDASPTSRGNLNWHLIRAMHHAGRCAECGECERACPMDIPLMDFMRSMQTLVRDKFSSDVPPRPGESPSPLSRFQAGDKEDFFR